MITLTLKYEDDEIVDIEGLNNKKICELCDTIVNNEYLNFHYNNSELIITNSKEDVTFNCSTLLEDEVHTFYPVEDFIKNGLLSIIRGTVEITLYLNLRFLKDEDYGIEILMDEFRESSSYTHIGLCDGSREVLVPLSEVYDLVKGLNITTPGNYFYSLYHCIISVYSKIYSLED